MRTLAINGDQAGNVNPLSIGQPPLTETASKIPPYTTQEPESAKIPHRGENEQSFRAAIVDGIALLPEITGRLIAGAAILPLFATSIVLFPFTLVGLFLTSSADEDMKEHRETRGQIKLVIGTIFGASFALGLYCIYHCFKEEIEGQI